MRFTPMLPRQPGPYWTFLAGLILLGAAAFAAVGTVPLNGPSSVPAKTRKPSPSLASLPPPKASGPLRILLVDDDWSENNGRSWDRRLSASDVLFRRLVEQAVGGDAGAWSVEVAPNYEAGPAFERLRDFNLVIWYNGGSYGGNPDNSAVLSFADERVVRRYLEETGGAFVLISPGYVNAFSYGNTWTSSPVAFLTEVVGINGVAGMVQRFKAGTVATPDGVRFAVRERGPVEPIFSGVNPDGAAVVFTAELDPVKTAAGGSPVAVAHPYGGGRFVYVGFSFENIVESEIDSAFSHVLKAAGRGPLAPARPAPVVPSRDVAAVAPIKPETLDAVVIRDVDFDNWGFEFGLRGWTKEGTAFDRQPTAGYNVSVSRVLTKMELANGGVGGDYWRDLGFPVGSKGTYWIGTYENNPGTAGSVFGATQGDTPTGALTSPEFKVTQDYCYFLLGGGAVPAAVWVELQAKQADGSWRTEAKRTSFRNSELMYRENFPLAAVKGKIARLRIVDRGTGNWGHINVDDFQFRAAAPEGFTLTDPDTGRTFLLDADYPVWGIADTHAHPAHNNGFGNRLIVGRAQDPMSQTYSNSLCQVNHTLLANPGLNSAFIGGADPHPVMAGWPDFVGYPRFNSRTHQQQHVEFLKRAWQGGLRLICALAVNNMYLPSLLLGPGSDGSPYDDDSVVLRQLADIKAIVASQSAWMEIAETPMRARQIIAQGKCAVVLGIETDNFGNFKLPGYRWDDKVGPNNRPLEALTPQNADRRLTEKVGQYYDLGVRQVTPIHYVTGAFGGAALFRGQIALVQFAFNHRISTKPGIPHRIPFSLYDDYSVSMAAVAVTPADYLTRIEGQYGQGTINALGMSEFGRTLTQKLMNKGVMIDLEHMGYETKNDLFALAATRGYPVMSSHTDPSGLCHNWLAAPTAFQGTDDYKLRNFGTTNIRNLVSEFTLADEHYEKIRASGGTVGVFMLPYFKNRYNGHWGAVADDCAGSTKTFAQMYLYSLDRMQGRGIGIASDRGMVDFIAPRFGPNAGYALADETALQMKRDLRREQRLAQGNGVKYDRPMSSFHPSWYRQKDLEVMDETEQDAWEAFAAFEASVPDAAVPESIYVGHALRVRNFVIGLRATEEAQLESPGIFNGDTPCEQAALYCIRRNRSPAALTMYAGLDRPRQERINAIIRTVEPAWRVWNQKYGRNQPLRRYRTGNRDWDFNTDGMAHYGLMPDFLQDLRNIGLKSGTIAPLFQSAEDYLRMWEKAAKSAAAPR